jgi:YggT family protein
MAILFEITRVLSSAISIYYVILLVRIFLSWLPNLDTGNPILSAIISITDPFLNIFRGLVPPIGGFDFSSLLAFRAIFGLQFLLDRSAQMLASSMSF